MSSNPLETLVTSSTRDCTTSYRTNKLPPNKPMWQLVILLKSHDPHYGQMRMRLIYVSGYTVCIHRPGYRKLIFSPDTDVYHIGLTVISLIPDTQVIVQLSKDHSEGARLLCLNTLLDELPDLADIAPNLRPQAMQLLYISTGCNYVSFFYRHW